MKQTPRQQQLQKCNTVDCLSNLSSSFRLCNTRTKYIFRHTWATRKGVGEHIWYHLLSFFRSCSAVCRQVGMNWTLNENSLFSFRRLTFCWWQCPYNRHVCGSCFIHKCIKGNLQLESSIFERLSGAQVTTGSNTTGRRQDALHSLVQGICTSLPQLCTELSAYQDGKKFTTDQEFNARYVSWRCLIIVSLALSGF